MGEEISYCGNLVRAHDRDRFLCSLFAPSAAREALWALFAFNHEIAKTREVVSDTQLGLIRLQWWRDAVSAIYEKGEAPEHEIVKALALAVEKYDLPRGAFETLLYAREFDLEGVPPENIEGLINYADFTTEPLMILAAHVTGANVDYEPVRQVAVNYALAGLLRAVPFYAQQGRVMLPSDLMQKYQLRPDKLESGENFKALVRELAGQFVKGLKPRDGFLAASYFLAEIYMKQIERVKYDLLNPKLTRPPFFKELRLYGGSQFHNLLLKV